MTYIKKQVLPTLDNSARVHTPDLDTIGNQNYTATILRYGNLTVPFSQLDTNAKTIVAAINELYARPIASHNVLNGGGTVVIANPITGNNNVLGTSSEDYIVTNLDYYIQVYQGEPAGLLYAVSIDGLIYDIENVSECDIDDLHNVDISMATQGQILQYSATTMKWRNVDASAITPTLGSLSDVVINSPQSGEALVYDAETDEWSNSIVSTVGVLNDLEDVAIENVTGGQVLKYDQETEKWVNADDASGISRLDELTDVEIIDPVEKQVLRYNGEEWVNGPGGDTWEGTQAEYDMILIKDPNTVYYITDAPAPTFAADAVTYNSSGTKLHATTVQSAITEIATTPIYWTDLTGILRAGDTSIRFEHDSISANSTVQIFVDDAFYGTSPTSVTVSPRYVTLVFEALESDMPVKVRIS